MFGSASLLLRLGGTLAAGAVVAAAAGCSSGGSSSPTSGTASSAASSATSAPASTASAPAPASGGSSAPAASQSPHAVATSQAPGVAACVTRDLRAKVVNTEGAAGSVYQDIDFTNAGSAPCSLYGYPGVSLGTGTPFTQVGAAAARSATASPAVVTLSPGQTANALLRVVQALNFPAATCSPKATTSLRIYPPNQKAALYLPYKATGCTSTSVKLLTIGVVQAGSGSNG